MAVMTALMALMLMLALGAGVTLTTMTEAAIAANHRDGLHALYAAEAGIDIAAARLQALDDWSAFTSAAGTAVVQGPLASLLPGSSVDPRIAVTVLALPDPDGNPNALVVQSTAYVAGGPRHSVHITVRR